MRLAGVSAVHPSRRVSNTDIVAMIRESKHTLSAQDEALYLEATLKLLKHAGSDNRFWLAEGERPADLLATAVKGALQQAELAPRDVEVVLCACVDRAFLEPSQASIYARELGLRPTRAFDVSEACASFSRALYLANLMLAAGEAKNVLIVSTEFVTKRGGRLDASFRPNALSELEWRFPAYTLGDCAAAMVLTAEDPPWTFMDHARVDKAGMCMVPFRNAPDYAPSLEIRDTMIDHFVSYGRVLHDVGKEEISAIWDRFAAAHPEKFAEVKVIVPHTTSSTVWQRLFVEKGANDRAIDVFPVTGNVITTSLPAGLHHAITGKRLARGDRALCLMAAAGMSMHCFSFTY